MRSRWRASSPGAGGPWLSGQDTRDVPRDSPLSLQPGAKPENLKYDVILRACDRSLKHLGMGYIDIYLIHWPRAGWNYEESFRALNKLVHNGKVKHLGVSNFNVKLLKQAQTLSETPIVTNQIPYSLADRSYVNNGVIEYCRQNDILVMAYEPVDKGHLRSNRSLDAIAKAHNANIYQIALAWLVAQARVVTIPMSFNPQHIKENFDAAEIELTSDEKATTEGVNLNFTISATDPDGTIPSFTTSTLPTGATFTNNGNGTGTFSWTPTFTRGGSYNVTFRATDGTLVDTERVAIIVNEAGNQTPVLAAMGARSTTEGVLLTFGASATDPDGTTPTLSASGLPAGATFTSNGNGTGTFNWTPSFTQAGSYLVIFIASDGVKADSEIVSITVNELGNQAPPVPERLLRRGDKYAAYLFQHVMPGGADDPVKPPGVLLSPSLLPRARAYPGKIWA